MTAAGIALIAGGLAILVGFRHLLWSGGKSRRGGRASAAAIAAAGVATGASPAGSQESADDTVTSMPAPLLLSAVTGVPQPRTSRRSRRRMAAVGARSAGSRGDLDGDEPVSPAPSGLVYLGLADDDEDEALEPVSPAPTDHDPGEFVPVDAEGADFEMPTSRLPTSRVPTSSAPTSWTPGSTRLTCRRPVSTRQTSSRSSPSPNRLIINRSTRSRSTLGCPVCRLRRPARSIPSWRSSPSSVRSSSARPRRGPLTVPPKGRRPTVPTTTWNPPGTRWPAPGPDSARSASRRATPRPRSSARSSSARCSPAPTVGRMSPPPRNHADSPGHRATITLPGAPPPTTTRPGGRHPSHRVPVR